MSKHSYFTSIKDDKKNTKNIAGQGPIDISALEVNHTYHFESFKRLYKIDGLPNPDEFWSEEKLKQWKNMIENIDFI